MTRLKTSCDFHSHLKGTVRRTHTYPGYARLVYITQNKQAISPEIAYNNFNKICEAMNGDVPDDNWHVVSVDYITDSIDDKSWEDIK